MSVCSATLWGVITLAASSLPPPTPVDIVRALEEIESGKPKAALTRLGDPAATDRGDVLGAETRMVAARAALAAGKPQEALALLEGLEARLPEVGDFVVELSARAHRAGHAWFDTHEDWSALLERYPNSPLAKSARFGIADALFGQARYPEARQAYEVAFSASKRSDAGKFSRFNLARIAEAQGRWKDAADIYRWFITRKPSDPLTEDAQRRHAELVTAKRASPLSIWDRLSRIDRLLLARSLDVVEAELTAIVEEGTPYKSAVRYRSAQLDYRRGRFEEALASFKRLARTTNEKKKAEYTSWMSRSYGAMGKTQEAIDTYLTLADSSTDEPSAISALFKAAWLAYNGGDHAKAVKLFSRFIDTYPEDSGVADALWFKAWNVYRMGDLPSAAKTLREMLRRYPVGSLAHKGTYWLARVNQKMGKRERAANYFRGVIKSDPTSYYSAMARQYLKDLPSLSTPDASETEAAYPLFTLASHCEAPTSLEPSRNELPDNAGLVPVDPLGQSPVPWGSTVLNWDSLAGKRVMRLLRLGLVGAAADAADALEPLPGTPADAPEVTYARARLALELGDYHRAFRLAARNFKAELAQPVSGANRRIFQLAYPSAYPELVSKASKEFGISPFMVLAIMRQESAFDDRARSWASANGLMQIIPRTGERIAEVLTVEDYNFGVLRDPAVNIRFGAWYLSALLEKFHGNLALAVGSYNAGPINMARWVDARAGSAMDEFVEDIPYRETRDYVKRVLGNLSMYSAVYGSGPLRIPDTVEAGYLDNVNF